MELKFNDINFQRKMRWAKAAVFAGIEAGMHEVFDQVGLRASRDHMAVSAGIDVGPGKTVTAPVRFESAPGRRRLAKRSGRLAGSLAPGGGKEQTRRIDKNGAEYIGTFGTRVPYAALHEYGLAVGTAGRRAEYPARPFLHPAVDEVEPMLPEIMKENIEKHLKP